MKNIKTHIIITTGFLTTLSLSPILFSHQTTQTTTNANLKQNTYSNTELFSSYLKTNTILLDKTTEKDDTTKKNDDCIEETYINGFILLGLIFGIPIAMVGLVGVFYGLGGLFSFIDYRIDRRNYYKNYKRYFKTTFDKKQLEKDLLDLDHEF